jgi:hypothetical protein
MGDERTVDSCPEPLSQQVVKPSVVGGFQLLKMQYTSKFVSSRILLYILINNIFSSVYLIQTLIIYTSMLCFNQSFIKSGVYEAPATFSSTYFDSATVIAHFDAVFVMNCFIL